MSDMQEYLDLKTNVEKARREADRATGARDQALQQLKEKFGCENLKDAEKRLREMKKDDAAVKKEFGEELDKFKEKWNEKEG